jgi:hypothetical protein
MIERFFLRSSKFIFSFCIPEQASNYNSIVSQTLSNHHNGRFLWEITIKTKKQEPLDFMDKFKLKSQFNESNTKIRSQLDHIWANVPGYECKFGVTKTYWLDF